MLLSFLVLNSHIIYSACALDPRRATGAKDNFILTTIKPLNVGTLAWEDVQAAAKTTCSAPLPISVVGVAK